MIEVGLFLDGKGGWWLAPGSRTTLEESGFPLPPSGPAGVRAAPMLCSAGSADHPYLCTLDFGHDGDNHLAGSLECLVAKWRVA